MLATLFNPPNEARSLGTFAFANADLHFRMNNALIAKGEKGLPFYILDPIYPEGSSLERWLAVHQDIHNRVNASLGIAGNDLSEVDFKNPEQLQSWIWLHAQEHLQAANKLGIS